MSDVPFYTQLFSALAASFLVPLILEGFSWLQEAGCSWGLELLVYQSSLSIR